MTPCSPDHTAVHTTVERSSARAVGELDASIGISHRLLRPVRPRAGQPAERWHARCRVAAQTKRINIFILLRKPHREASTDSQ